MYPYILILSRPHTYILTYTSSHIHPHTYILTYTSSHIHPHIYILQFNLKSQANQALSLNGYQPPGSDRHLVVKYAEDQHKKKDRRAQMEMGMMGGGMGGGMGLMGGHGHLGGHGMNMNISGMEAMISYL